MNKSLLTHLNRLDPDRKSTSRIFGAAVESWAVAELTCDCGGSYADFPANKKGVDLQCESCSKLVQVKCSKKPFKPNRKSELKIMGAEYTTTLTTLLDSPFDLLLVEYDSVELMVNDVKLVRAGSMSSESVEPRKPLSSNARRAGWQGCYLVFHVDQVETIPL